MWHKVTEALVSGNYNQASKEKHDIEEHQRALRKERQAKNESWAPKFFAPEPVRAQSASSATSKKSNHGSAAGFWMYTGPSN